MSEFEIREIDGKYYLYCADEDIDVEWTFDSTLYSTVLIHLCF